MTYKIAGITDIEQLVEMRIGYIECDQGQLSESDKKAMLIQLPSYFMAHLNKDLIAFIAKEDGVIIAIVLLQIIEKPASPFFIYGKVGEVLNVFTREEFQHKGIATKLMLQLIEYAKNNDLDRIDLNATPKGYHLYKKVGFQEKTGGPYTEMRYTVDR
jgi:ribosomal protein S18 acetylase RimI-like enzyme